jgi:Domain of unknown function (DUF4440)
MKALVLLLVLISAPAALFAQSDLQTTQDKQYKVKVKGDKQVERDKSKPVRRALEEQYARLAQANRDKNLAALLALRSPDFTAKLPNGQVWNYEQAAAYSRAAFEQVQSIISLTNDIQTIEVHGNEAVAIVHQQWSRMQIKAGKLRRVDTSAVQRETWVNTPEGWRLKLVDEVHPGAWYVDGKRIDPSKPYDPDAPPFVPGGAKPE